MKARNIDIEVIGNHVRLSFGNILMHSEEYANPSNAKRAARSLVKSINERPMRLILPHRGKMVVERVRKIWARGGGTTIAFPVDYSPSQGAAYFDPALEMMGS